MEYGNLMIVCNIQDKNTRPIFNEFLANDTYDTLVFEDFFSVKYHGVHYKICLYIQPIANPADFCLHAHFTTMTKLKKIAGWTHYEGSWSPGSVVGETIQALSEYLHVKTFPESGELVIPIESKIAIEARGSSDWQAVNAVAAQYDIVAVKYCLDE